MGRRSLFKYYSRREHAESFLDGQLLFRSLSYFRDYEDNGVRSDQYEGASVLRPAAGLVVNNQTQNKTFILEGWSFVSAAPQDEIFAFCMSRSLTLRLCKEFGAVACVEILDPRMFCARIQEALAPNATFPAAQGRAQLGHRVEYYDETETGNPRWALPDKIATSKLRRYAWQDEFRLVFSVSDAFQFQNVALSMWPTITEMPAIPADITSSS